MVQGIFQGYSSPVRKRQFGFFTPFAGSDTIRASITHILGTKIGERVHLIEFGSRLHELVFEPNDQVFISLAKSFVEEALARWEQRIEMINTEVLLDPNNKTAHIRVTYQLRGPIPNPETLVIEFDRGRGIII